MTSTLNSCLPVIKSDNITNVLLAIIHIWKYMKISSSHNLKCYVTLLTSIKISPCLVQHFFPRSCVKLFSTFIEVLLRPTNHIYFLVYLFFFLNLLNRINSTLVLVISTAAQIQGNTLADVWPDPRNSYLCQPPKNRRLNIYRKRSTECTVQKEGFLLF